MDSTPGISWATPLLMISVYGLISFFRMRHNKHDKSLIRWSAWEAVGVSIFIYFGSQILGTLLAYGYPSLMGWSNDRALDWFQNSAVGQFWLILLIEVISVGLLVIFLRRRQSNLRAIGLDRRPKLGDLGHVLAGYAVYFITYLVTITAVKGLIPSIDVDQEQQIGFEAAQGIELLLVFISLVILPPIAEELLMRGFLYSGLKKALPKVWAIVGTSLLFAIAHLQFGGDAPLLWVAAIDTFVLSVVLIHLKERTGGRLWAPLGLHALKNGIAFLSIFVFHVVK